MDQPPFPFQHLDALTRTPGGRVVFIQHDAAHTSVPAPPRFMFGDCTHQVMHRYYQERHICATGLYIAADVELYAESLLFRDAVALASPEIHMNHDFLPAFLNDYHAHRHEIRRKPVNGKSVLLLGPGHTIYGHWLADFLPKLFMLVHAGYDLAEFRYLVPNNTPDFGLVLLDLLGITADRRVTYDVETDLVSPEVLFIPTMVRQSCRTAPLFNQAVAFARSLIWQRNGAPAIQPKRRIYVSRSEADKDNGTLLNRRTLLNRDRIEDRVRQAGFEIVHPEQHPLLEQFAMFRDAEAIIGEYGSALHTSIFSERNPIICALQGAGPSSTFLQSGICHALSQPMGYVFGPFNDDGAAFSIDEDAFATCLNLIFDGVPLA